MADRIGTRFPSSDSVRALGLEPAVATRLARHLDRYMTRPHTGRPGLREAIRAATSAMLLAGTDAGVVVERLTAVVAEHAQERGWTQTSVVSGLPRYADAMARVAEWSTSDVGLTDHPAHVGSPAA